jgi:hypothetical protein
VCGGYCSISHLGAMIAELGISAQRAAQDIHDELRQGITRTSLCTFAIRRRVIDKVGGFREYFVSSSDIDYMLRLGEVAHIRYLPENTYYYRLHESSITHTQARNKREFYERTARDFQIQRLRDGTDALQRGLAPSPPESVNERASSAASQIQGMLVGKAWRLFEEGESSQALRVAARAVRHGPANPAPWRALLMIGLRSVGRTTR